MKNVISIIFTSCIMGIVAGQVPEVKAKEKAGKKVILLDRYYNSEKKTDSAGTNRYWHYDWYEKSDPGFAILGNIFTTQGGSLATLDEGPTAASLAKAAVYIIVDPDNKVDNPSPNYISEKEVKIISDWVKAGGVLLLMANDSANCEMVHLNKLSNIFGIQFTGRNGNMVEGEEFETGAVEVKEANPIFAGRKMFLKGISILDLQAPAKAVLTKDSEVVAATAVFGKGTVFAVGDPWLYNEYVIGRLPAEYDNKGAAEDLVSWLLKQTRN